MAVLRMYARSVRLGDGLWLTRQVVVSTKRPLLPIGWHGKEDGLSYQTERTSCIVVTTGERLPEPYRGAYFDLLMSEQGADRVQVVYANAGLKVSATSIRKHRGGYCACPNDKATDWTNQNSMRS